MAITTFDGASSGVRPPVAFSKVTSGTLVAGRPFSYWPIAGAPGAGAYNTTLAGATRSNADAGSLSKGNPASGNAYLYNLVASASGQDGERNALVRGVDFAMIPAAHGGPTLVLHDMATKFEASYSNDFADALAAGGRA